MQPVHVIPGRLWVWAWGALLVGLPAAGANAWAAPPPAADSVASTPAPLPPTLTGLRVELLVPPTRPARRPARRDRWWARDKARHVVFSGLWTLSAQYVLVQKAGWSDDDALPVSVASSATVGLAKELYDASRIGGQASGKDLVANAVGIGLAVGVIAL